MTWTGKTWLDNSPPTLQDVDLNKLRSSTENPVTSSGQTPNTSDQNQLTRSIAIYSAGSDFYTDSGGVNSYVLTPVGSKLCPSAYFDGMKVRFIPDNTNTGPSTINVNGIGAISIKQPDGTDVEGGNINVSRAIDMFHDIGTGTFRITPNYAMDTERGMISIASQAESNALASTTKALTPARQPISSSIQKGIIQIATQIEVDALSSVLLAVTPGRIPISDDTKKGIIEIATQAEVDALSATDLAVTPGTIPISSETKKGIVEKATAAEVATGTDTERFIAPSTAGSHISAAKSWVNFNGVGTLAIRSSYNVSSVTDNGTGNYTVNFSTNFSDSNYLAAAFAGDGSGNASDVVFGGSSFVQTTSAFTVNTSNDFTGGFNDMAIVHIVFFGV